MRQGTLVLLLTGVALVGLFWLTQPLQSLQGSLSDRLFRAGSPPDGIVLADIDDRSLAVRGNFNNWSRTLHASAIDNLTKAGARVVVLDVIFGEPSPDDPRLAEAMKAAKNVVLPGSGTEGLSIQGADRYTYKNFLQPPEPLRGSAFQVGHVNFPPDVDGVLRRIPLVVSDSEGRQHPSAALAALYAETQRPVPELVIEDGHIRVLNQLVPVDEAGAMRPNFTIRASDFRRISYTDIIAGAFDASLVRGKIVLVGATFTGSGDEHPVPLGGSQPGVTAIANVLQSLQDGVFVREASRAQVALALVPLVAVMMYTVPRFNVRLTALLLILMGGGYYLFAIALFNSDQKLVLNFVYAAVVLPAMFLVGLVHRVTAERADRRDLSDLFGRLASPEIVQELVESADRGELELGGNLREVTVLFADLRGFTGISERMPPHEVVMFLNRAFDVMISAIVRNEGIVNKFGGDMVMAIWNAPRDTAGHALKACRAAHEALAEMERQGMWLPQEPNARFGFGINSGEVVAGNVGSAGRLEYTVMGDAVNVGSRLCGMAGGGEVWVGERTRDLAGSSLEVEGLGPQTLKGRSQPVEAYRVVSVEGVAGPAVAAAVT